MQSLVNSLRKFYQFIYNLYKNLTKQNNNAIQFSPDQTSRVQARVDWRRLEMFQIIKLDFIRV